MPPPVAAPSWAESIVDDVVTGRQRPSSSATDTSPNWAESIVDTIVEEPVGPSPSPTPLETSLAEGGVVPSRGGFTPRVPLRTFLQQPSRPRYEREAELEQRLTDLPEGPSPLSPEQVVSPAEVSQRFQGMSLAERVMPVPPELPPPFAKMPPAPPAPFAVRARPEHAGMPVGPPPSAAELTKTKPLVAEAMAGRTPEERAAEALAPEASRISSLRTSVLREPQPVGKEFVRGLERGTIQAIGSLGPWMEALGYLSGSDRIALAGGKLSKTARAKLESIPPAVTDRVAEDPSVLLDREWWEASLGQLAPSVAVSYVPAGLAVKLAQIIGPASMSPALLSALARLGIVTGATAGGMQEGSSTYEETLKRGGTKLEAINNMVLMSAASGALNYISLDRWLKTSGRSLLTRMLIQGPTESVTEALEEPAEAIIMGKRGLPAREVLKNMVEVMPPTLVMGMVMGVIGGDAQAKALKDAREALRAAADNPDLTPEGAKRLIKELTGIDLDQPAVPTPPFPPPPPPAPPAMPTRPTVPTAEAPTVTTEAVTPTEAASGAVEEIVNEVVGLPKPENVTPEPTALEPAVAPVVAPTLAPTPAPTSRPAKPFDWDDPDALDQFIRSRGGIAPSTTKDLSAEYREIPLRLKNRRGLTPERMAEAVSELTGREVTDAELLTRLRGIGVERAAKAERAGVTQRETARVEREAELAALPEDEKVRQIAAMLGTSPEAAAELVATATPKDEVTTAEIQRAFEDFYRRYPDEDARSYVIDMLPQLQEPLGVLSGQEMADRHFEGSLDALERALAAAKATAAQELPRPLPTARPVERPAAAVPPTEPVVEAERPPTAVAAPLERGAPPEPAPMKTERTPEGEQGVVPGLPQRAIPTTKIQPTVPQRPIEETPLFGQERAAREAALEAAQGELVPAAEPQRPAETERPTYEHADRFGGLVQRLRDEISKGTLPKDPSRLRAIGAEVMGVEEAFIRQDAEAIDDLFDALEVALNSVYRARRPESATLGERIERANKAEAYLGNRTRTIEIMKRQQFSTPLPIAEAAAYALDLQSNEMVVEPTAGTGNLLAPLPPDTRVLANEIDPRRAEGLRSQGYDVRQEDALRAALPGDVVLMNPPWGKYSTGKYGPPIPLPFESVDVAERFVAKALREVSQGGRLVAVMPTTILRNPSFMKWISTAHTLRGLIQSPPKAYTTRGTDVESVLLVVDQGRVADAPDAIRGKPQDWAEYRELVTPLGEGGTHNRTRPTAVAPTPPAIEPGVRAAPRAAPAAEQPRPPSPPPARPAERATETGVPGVGVAPEPRAGEPSAGVVATRGVERAPAELEGADRGLSGDVYVAPQRFTETVKGERFSVASEAELDAAQRSTVFAPAPLRSGPGDNPHPRLIVITRSLAGARRPDLTYQAKGRLLWDAYGRKVISDQQLDYGILPALQANADGHGFLSAADVGVGKSRIAAGVIAEWLESGQASRVLYVTASEVNIQDLKREFEVYAGGAFPGELIEVKTFPGSKERPSQTEVEALPRPAKVVYLIDRYNLTAYRKALSDLNVDAIVGDEAHLYKNIGDSQVGKAWLMLQTDVLKRRGKFLYLTATPAVEFTDLEAFVGLREWMPGGFVDFLAKVTGTSPEARGDLGALKTLFERLRRQWSEAPVPASEQQRILDSFESPDLPFLRAEERRDRLERATDILRAALLDRGMRVDTAMGTEAGEAGVTTTSKGFFKTGDAFAVHVTPSEQEQVMREFAAKNKYDSVDLWRDGVEFTIAEESLSEAQRVEYRQLTDLFRDLNAAFLQFGRLNKSKRTFSIMSFLQQEAKRRMFDYRFPRALQIARESLARGERVVISTISVSEGREDQGPIPAAINMINARLVEADPETGEIVRDEEIPEALVVRGELLERWQAFRQPPSPVDVVLGEFGRENVALVTGNVAPRVREQMIRQFQEGRRSVAMISGAGKVGISLHHVVENEGEARGRRHLVVTDFEWSSVTFKQEMGRVDRSGQLTSPRITVLSSGAAAEKKFLATIANRMRNLGAMSKGSAESASNDKLAEFEIAGGLDTHAMRTAYASLPAEIQSLFLSSAFRDPNDRTRNTRSYPSSASLKDFLLSLQFMPTEASDRAFEAFWRERERVIAEQEQGEFELLKGRTQTNRGELLRSTALRPDLLLHEVRDEGGHKFGIVQGLVTDYMTQIGRFLDRSPIGTPVRRYLTFRAGDQQIAGLEIRPGTIAQLMRSFGKTAQQELGTPDAVLEALRAGDRVKLQGEAGYVLRQRPSDQRIQVEGAKMSQRENLLRHGAKYSPTGNFFFLTPELVPGFLERFPPIKPGGEATEAPTVQEAPTPYVAEKADEIKGLPGSETTWERPIHEGEAARLLAGFGTAPMPGPPSPRRVQRVKIRQGDTYQTWVARHPEMWIHDYVNRRGGLPGSGFARLVGLEPEAAGPLAQEAPGEYAVVPPFFSQLQRAIEQKMPERAVPGHVRAIANQAAKADEIKWTGLDDWLKAQKGKVSKQEVLDFLRQNEVRVEEVVKASGVGRGLTAPEAQRLRDLERLNDVGHLETAEQQAEFLALIQKTEGRGETKFAQYTLPGGEKYRELLLTLIGREPEPVEIPPVEVRKVNDNQWQIENRLTRPGENLSGLVTQWVGSGWEEHRQSFPDGGRDFRGSFQNQNREFRTFDEAVAWVKEVQAPVLRRVAEQERGTPGYRSPHFDEPNVLAHVRFDEREGGAILKPGGPTRERVLFIQEIQDDLQNEIRRVKREIERAKQGGSQDLQRELAERLNRLENLLPFRGKSHELVLKYMLRYAAEHGYDKVAWTTGEMQAERYDLSKQIDALQWNTVAQTPSETRVLAFKNEEEALSQRIADTELENWVGKDLAKKIIDAKSAGRTEGEYSGLDLKVGGEGLKALYDRIIPQFLNQYGKKWGARVGETTLDFGRDLTAKSVYRGPEYTADALSGKQFGLNATLEMQIMSVQRAMRAGDPFRVAIEREGSPALAKALGGKFDDLPQKIEKVPSLDITPAMRESVMTEGQALFERSGKYIPRRKDYNAKAKDAEQAALRAVDERGRDVSSARGVVGIPAEEAGGLRTVAVGITRQLATQGRVVLRGLIVRTARDLARIAQVFRHPGFETLRIVYTKGDALLDYEGVSSRLPAAALPFVDLSNQRARIKWRHEIEDRMRRLGADGYWLIHNHPSGDSTPSTNDMALTTFLNQFLPGFKGHVVIDSGEFSVLTKEGGTEYHAMPEALDANGRDALLTPELPDQRLRRRLKYSADVAAVGAASQSSPDMVVLIYTARQRVRMIQEVPRKFFLSKDSAGYIKNRAREVAGADVFSYFPSDEVDIKARGLALMDSGHVRDHLWDTFSLGRWGYERSKGKMFGEPMGEMRTYRVGEEESPRPRPRYWEEGPPQSVSPMSPNYQVPTTPRARQDVISKREMILRLQDVLDRAIRVGKVPPGKRGIFKPGPEVIRVKGASNLPTVAHEIGHFLDTRGLLPTQRHKSELEALGQGRQGDPVEEGTAEFLRLYIEDPAEADRRVPGLSRMVDARLDEAWPELHAALLDARDQLARFRQSDLESRAASMIDQSPRSRGVHLTARTFPDFWGRFYTAIVDTFNPILQFERMAAHGIKLAADKSAYLLARVARGVGGVADTFLTIAPVDWRTLKLRRDIPSFQAAILPIYEHRTEFDYYLMFRRLREFLDHSADETLSERERARFDKAASSLLSALETTPQAVRDVIPAMDARYPAFERAAADLQKWSDALLDYIQDSGRYSEETIERIKRLHRSYAPFFRVMEEEGKPEPAKGAGGKRVVDLPSPLKRLKGSERRIRSPLESFVHAAHAIVSVANRNEVGVALANLAESTEGLGRWMEKVRPTSVPTTFELEEIRAALEQAGLELEEADLATVATVFRPIRQEKNTVTIYRNGNAEHWLIGNTGLYDALLSLEPFQLPPWAKLLAVPAKTFRAGVVFSPVFQIRNMFRDQLVVAMQYGYVPFKAYADGLLDALGGGEMRARWKASGGAIFSTLVLDRIALERKLQDVMEGTVRVPDMVNPRHPIELGRAWLRLAAEFTEWSESPTRVGVFKHALEHPKTEDVGERAVALRAAFESREASLDFARYGQAIRAWTQITSFMNPWIQGVDKTFRTAYNHPIRMAAMGAAMMLGEYYLYQWNKTQPCYRDIPQWQRDIFYVLALPNGKGCLKLPGPFEYKALFSALPRRLFEWWDETDPDLFASIGEVLERGFGQNVIPTAFRPLIENAMDWNEFRKRPLTPRGLEEVAPAEQYTPTTTELAKRLGRLFGYSPIKIDHLIQAYTGTMGADVTSLLDGLLKESEYGEPPTKFLSDYPIIRAFVGRSPSLSAEPIERFYDYLKRAIEAKRTRDLHKRRGTMAAQYDVDHAWELAIYSGFVNQARRFSMMRRQLNGVRQDPEMSGAEKRRITDLIVNALVDLAEGNVEGANALRKDLRVEAEPTFTLEEQPARTRRMEEPEEEALAVAD